MPYPTPAPSANDPNDDGYDDHYDDYACPDCEDGVMLVCIDDMCRGAGECFHGDGYATCPRCKGSGEITPRR